MTMAGQSMNELGFYTLAGAPESARDLIAEVQAAEQMGIGSAFVSERLNIKEAATICGAGGAVSGNLPLPNRAPPFTGVTPPPPWS